MKNKFYKLSLLLLLPLLAFALQKIPHVFGKLAINFAARQYVELAPYIDTLRDDGLYNEFDANIPTHFMPEDSITGRSFKIKLLYLKYNLSGFVYNAFNELNVQDGKGAYDVVDEGRQAIKSENGSAGKYLIAGKKAFWKELKSACEDAKIDFNKTSKNLKKVLETECQYLSDLQKMDTMELRLLFALVDEDLGDYGWEYKYWYGSENNDYVADSFSRIRREMVAKLENAARKYHWKYPVSVNQQDKSKALDYAWLLNIITIRKYQNSNGIKATIANLLSIMNTLKK